ncbi:MAG: thioredoxin domain-containing protein [Acidobacteria bacterium]|nr:thioredoxin domain-containing protein [Acidobacteriota bacterium]MBI3654867.1 thioredoxin domain-containing protein [Acidobacteriota bacterium]
MKEYDGKITVVFKHYPLEMHNWAMKAALATEAVFQLKPDAFWELHDQLFSVQKEIKVDNLDAEVEGFLKSNKIDIAEYQKKLASDSVKKAVERDLADVKAIGLRSGTPSYYIDGRFLAGAQPIDNFRKVIDEALSDAGLAKPASTTKAP